MNNNPKKGATIIALCGKGGVGKTSLSAMIVRILAGNPEKRVLAIDADPAVGLSTALGIEAAKTVDDIRNDLIQLMEKGAAESKADILSRLDYEMFSAIEERDNIAFLAIGRSEKEGCYCQVNHILKDIIAAMADNFDYVVIDGEAGVEQVNRRVMEKVTHLALVSDASAKGLNVVDTILQVSKSAIQYDRVGLILNRLRNEKERQRIRVPDGMECLGWVPEDDVVRDNDIDGKSILNAPDCQAIWAAENCLERFGLPIKFYSYNDGSSYIKVRNAT